MNDTMLFCPVCAARIRPLRPATGDTYTLRADEQAVCTCGAIFGEGDTLDTTCPICDGEGRIPADGCGELAGGWADPCDCTTDAAGGRTPILADATITLQKLTIEAAEQRIDDLIESRDAALDLVAELRADVARLQSLLDTERRIPLGRYAFYHRHLAMSYVRKRAPELANEASVEAGHRIDQEGGWIANATTVSNAAR